MKAKTFDCVKMKEECQPAVLKKFANCAKGIPLAAWRLGVNRLPGSGSPVGRGADPARADAPRARNAAMQGRTPLDDRNATMQGRTPLSRWT